MTKKADTTTVESIVPYFIYRKSEFGRLLFGYGSTQLDELIKRGEIPKPIKLSESGRAEGWLGSQIIEHHERMKERVA